MKVQISGEYNRSELANHSLMAKHDFKLPTAQYLFLIQLMMDCKETQKRSNLLLYLFILFNFHFKTLYLVLQLNFNLSKLFHFFDRSTPNWFSMPTDR